MIPPIYHSLRRESIKNTNSASAIGVKSVRPTWFEDIEPPGNLHSLNRCRALSLSSKRKHCLLKSSRNSQHQQNWPNEVCLLLTHGAANERKSDWKSQLMNAWHNHWTKWRWTPRTVTYASRLATAYWRSCSTKLRPSRHNLNVRKANVKRTVKQPYGCAQSLLSSAFPIIMLLSSFLYWTKVLAWWTLHPNRLVAELLGFAVDSGH